MTAVDLRLGDCLDVLRGLNDESAHAVVTDPPYGLEFMGRDWDGQVPGVAYWRECLRVLKPGAHLLAFGGTRTHHRLAVAIEDAGFEIRDSIAWLYGSGFPKSLDVSKAIDKAAGAEREIVAIGSDGAKRKPRAMAPGGAPREAVQTVSAPATPAAEQWQGWGTALKPAQEPIIVARKPMAGTVAANVLAHGTGAINVDACRVQYASEADRAQAAVPQPSFGVKADGAGTYNYRAGEGRGGERFEPGAGRWPANVVLVHAPECRPDECVDACPVAELDRQSGIREGGHFPKRAGSMGYHGGGRGIENGSDHRHEPAGASRFYPVFRYQAKAPSKERPKIDGKGWPTVKPLALMRWLVRLVTPPGGTVLDPFAGTGPTLQAAELEGFASIGIERDEFAYRLACQRLGLPDPEVAA